MRRKRAFLEAAALSRRIGSCSVAQDITQTVGARYSWRVFRTADELREFDPLGQRVQEVVHFQHGMPAGVFVRSPLAPAGWRLK